MRRWELCEKLDGEWHAERYRIEYARREEDSDHLLYGPNEDLYAEVVYDGCDQHDHHRMELSAKVKRWQLEGSKEEEL